MTLRNACVALALVLCASTSFAQQQTGEIFGRLQDKSGAVLPGATVTVTGPALIQPRVTTTAETGAYRVPELPVGTYTVTFELPGFRTVAFQDIRVTIGFRAQVNAELELSSVQETVTVTGESPIVDTRETGTKTAFDLETLQNIPSARDPWVMLERTPGITMDRVNVGGSQSGQQSTYISRGATTTNNKWSIDGVDITDMSATGASPIYYDFDMLEEMQVTTGGSDITQQTGGVGINLVTRSGTDRFKGSGRLYITDEKFQSDNVTAEARAGGVGAGAPIQNIRDYGFEVGGPIRRSRAWYWGSYGTQDIKVGVVGFYKNNDTCRPGGVAINPRTADTALLRSCLETDLTTLNNYNWKVQFVPFTNNKVTIQNTWAEKVRNARDASDLRPIETTYRQKAVDKRHGAFGWITGPSPFWKASDQHVISDRWLMDVQWAHLGNNFVLDFHEDSLADVQARLETTTGRWSRSFQASVFTRPTNSLDIVNNYFLPAMFGGDHALKFGYRWRSAHSTSLNHHGGFADARFTNGVANSVDLWRDGNSVFHLDTHALYLQDVYTRNRLTLNLGVRWDRQDDEALPAQVPANPILPAILPALDFRGADAGVVWSDVSPRIGMTYDLTGDGRSVLSSSYAIYFGQMAPGQLSGELSATGAVLVRYPWNDLNGDEFVQANEVTITAQPLTRSAAYDPGNPGNTRSPGRVDPNVKNDRTREFIIGFDRQIGNMMAVGGSYIWRKYDRFVWRDRDNFTSADMRAVTYTPPAGACPAGARCDTVTYYEPTVPLPSAYTYTNVPERYRDYNGFELTFQKRYADRWSFNASYAFNDAVDHWTMNSLEDPTCRGIATAGAMEGSPACVGEMAYAPEAGGSGIDNVFINAKWLVKLNGRVTMPWDINVAGAYNARQGYPFLQAILTPSRANSGGQVRVLLDRIGEQRLPSLQTVDIRFDRAFRFGQAQIRPTVDIFNLGNVGTVLAKRTNQAAANANEISGIVAPRVVRFGVQVNW